MVAFLVGLAFAVHEPIRRPAPPGTWTLKTPRPTITNEAAAVAIGGKLYAPGGSQNGKSMDRLDEYDPATDRWRSRAPMPQPLDHLGVAVVNDKLYTVGGFIGRAPGRLRCRPGIRSGARQLAAALPMKGPRSAVGVAALNGKIHVIGGRLRDNDLLATHEVYDPATGQWSDAAPLPLARDHLAVVAVDGRIHAIGGRLSTPDEPTAQHDIYDPGTNTWTAGPPLPTPRSGVAAEAYRGMILVIGGETRKARLSRTRATT